jgi:putative membrane protein
MTPARDHFTPYAITRPDRQLLNYYILVSLLSGPFFPIALLPLVLKFITLRYKFDAEGISMSWGVFFKKEVLLTYRRIQDIHLNRNILQRWMNLATVAIQTASGAATAEMSIEGILEAEALRDFLYERMRGAKGQDRPVEASSDDEAPRGAPADEALVLLTEIRDALVARATR